MLDEHKELFIRLYFDEDVHKRLAHALRLRSFDAISAHELARWGLSDEDQLIYASNNGRTIFTFNTSDYVQLHFEWYKAAKEHHGIIVSDQIPIGEAVRRLLNMLNHLTAEEIYNQLYWLQAFK